MNNIPLIDKVVLPMQNLDKEWYVAHARGTYPYHPPCFDWNLESFGNTDLGEPLVAPFNGIVLSAHDWRGGIGKVIQILGMDILRNLFIWSGWHLEEVYVTGYIPRNHAIVSCGELIGSIGNADGRYRGAHLHEQICIVGRNGIPHPRTYADDKRYDWISSHNFYCNNSIGAYEGISSEVFHRYFALDGR